MNSFQYQAAAQMNLDQIIPETQPLQFPKIDHILAHAKNPGLSKIYTHPEFQASASASELEGMPNFGKSNSSSNKKSRNKNKRSQVHEKKSTGKFRKNEIYEKYYLDDSRMKKVTPMKKVKIFELFNIKIDLWSRESWEDILSKKKKFHEFCSSIGFKIAIEEYSGFENKNDELDSQRIQKSGNINIEKNEDSYKETPEKSEASNVNSNACN